MSNELPLTDLLVNIQMTEDSLDLYKKESKVLLTTRHNLEEAYKRVINENPYVSCDGNFIKRLYSLQISKVQFEIQISCYFLLKGSRTVKQRI